MIVLNIQFFTIRAKVAITEKAVKEASEQSRLVFGRGFEEALAQTNQQFDEVFRRLAEVSDLSIAAGDIVPSDLAIDQVASIAHRMPPPGAEATAILVNQQTLDDLITWGQSDAAE